MIAQHLLASVILNTVDMLRACRDEIFCNLLSPQAFRYAPRVPGRYACRSVVCHFVPHAPRLPG